MLHMHPYLHNERLPGASSSTAQLAPAHQLDCAHALKTLQPQLNPLGPISI